MGTSMGSIHVYSTEKVEGFGSFHSLSEGWQTFITDDEPENPLEFRKLAKKISKSVSAPVLWFFLFDDDAIQFEFFVGGKRAAAYDQSDTNSCKNLYGIPALVGYESGQKRRLSKILSCGDIDFQLEMLEEYFGLCLVPFPELLEEAPEKLRRSRGDVKYLEFLAEEKKLSGRQAPIKAELVWEQTGKLFYFRSGDKRVLGLCKKPQHYYFGFNSPEYANALLPVRFADGKLMLISQEEFDAVEVFPLDTIWSNEFCITEYYPQQKIHFTEKAPEGFHNKTLLPPRGMYVLCFDGKGHVLLANERGSLAVADETMKIIAKMQLKGNPVEYRDGYVLTAGGESFWAYFYNSSNKIRIYRIVEK